ncbi:hypothetical protein FE257_000853 [Aspergillus nanangensis]|uniref:Xylanolytic transcriptional activator regulatory domain-containing protein n=1 Tax=Aspergillus nanangensis TaxID=2582783 RepID=A0AAD4CEE0_ASPNN|nr:hypothetical protein FE257_000853 [Aspergillus nanangensis]
MTKYRLSGTREIEQKGNEKLNTPTSSATIRVRQSSPQIYPLPIPLPKFVKPIPSRLKRDEVCFLQIKGAFNVPDIISLRPFLKAYVDHVHPYMPVLDLQGILFSITQNDRQRPISLFLLQSILFVSSTFVPDTLLETVGYSDRSSARRTLLYRAKVLYDFDVEDDSLAIVQGLLLLTFWHGTPDDLTGCWYWAGLSLTWAFRMGLHQEDSARSSRINPRYKHLRRRIWWSVYIRDRLTALWMQRPARIDDVAFNIPPLTIEDFDAPISSTVLLRFMTDSSYLSNPHTQKTLEKIFIDLSNLCVSIGQVLAVKFSTWKLGPVTSSTPSLARPSSSDVSTRHEWRVEECALGLRQWLQKHGSRYLAEDLSTEETIVTINASLVHMLHATALVNLYISNTTSQSPPEYVLLNCSYPAATVTKIMGDLSQRKLIQYLPITAVNILISTIAIHVIEVNSSDLETRSRGYSNLNKCLQILGELSKTYSAATWANIFFEASALGSSASLPFRALQRGQESQPFDCMSNPTEPDGLLTNKPDKPAYVDPAELTMDVTAVSGRTDCPWSAIM